MATVLDFTAYAKTHRPAALASGDSSARPLPASLKWVNQLTHRAPKVDDINHALSPLEQFRQQKLQERHIKAYALAAAVLVSAILALAIPTYTHTVLLYDFLVLNTILVVKVIIKE